MDEQGWRTIETFEKLNHVCEHGVKDGDWCEQCRKDVEVARNYENQVGSHGEPMPYGGD